MENADKVIVCMGSIAGTIKDAIDELKHENGINVGCLSIISYRPFPEKEIFDSLKAKKEIIVLEKAFAIGKRGVLGDEIKICLENTDCVVKNIVAGLGGRSITKSQIKEILICENLQDFSFLALDENLVRSNAI